MGLEGNRLCRHALPRPIIQTFIIMEYIGYSMNTVTLLALSLVAGILIDDAIVDG